MSNEDVVGDVAQTSLECGLKTEEARRRLVAFGFNEVPERETSFWVTLGKRFWGVVPWMLEVKKDYTGFTGTDPKFLKWCRDLFLHYWEQAKPIGPIRATSAQ